MATGARKKVVILGGGVAGMSAAHELVERGFEVEVFERKAIPGGKARSIAATESSLGRSPFAAKSSGARPPRGKSLPGEHGFRFFPGFYRHVVDTMAGFPTGAGVRRRQSGRYDRAQNRRRSIAVVRSCRRSSPRAPGDLRTDLFAIAAILPVRPGSRWTTACSSPPRCGSSSPRAKSGGWSSTSESTGGTSSRPSSRSAAYQKYFGNGDHPFAGRGEGAPREHQDHRRHLRPDRLQHPDCQAWRRTACSTAPRTTCGSPLARAPARGGRHVPPRRRGARDPGRQGWFARATVAVGESDVR